MIKDFQPMIAAAVALLAALIAWNSARTSRSTQLEIEESRVKRADNEKAAATEREVYALLNALHESYMALHGAIAIRRLYLETFTGEAEIGGHKVTLLKNSLEMIRKSPTNMAQSLAVEANLPHLDWRELSLLSPSVQAHVYSVQSSINDIDFYMRIIMIEAQSKTYSEGVGFQVDAALKQLQITQGRIRDASNSFIAQGFKPLSISTVTEQTLHSEIDVAAGQILADIQSGVLPKRSAGDLDSRV